jgi:predicted 3-demethylubiquinone-9 3-methyltransferase (glyoxalase superfamily)
MVKIRPFLWFDAQAEDAAKLYTSIFEGSEIRSITRKPAGVPGPTDVLVVTFTVAGQEVVALNGGPGHPQTDAFSLSADVETQAEVDRIWMGLLEGGGKEIQCGWLRDRFGVHWQVVPTILPKLLADPNPKKAAAVAGAMMKMIKLDVARLQAAYDAA